MATEWKLRDDFEAWVNNPHKLARRTEPGYTDEYEHPWTAGAWAAWKVGVVLESSSDPLQLDGEP